jgi:hypothetical protein
VRLSVLENEGKRKKMRVLEREGERESEREKDDKKRGSAFNDAEPCDINPSAPYL